MNKLLYIFFFLILMNCQNKRIEYEYYQNGKIKSIAEIRNNKKHGTLLEYDTNGILKYKEEWVNDLLSGSFVEYYPDGMIKKMGINKDNYPVEMTHFFENGKIFSIQNYDDEGYIHSARNYKKNGELDSVAFTYINVHSVHITDSAKLKCRLVNVLNPLDPPFNDGELIITSGFDTTKLGKVPKDTLAVVHSEDGLGYEYVFKPDSIGENFVYGQLVLKKDEGKTTSVRVTQFETSFHVYR